MYANCYGENSLWMFLNVTVAFLSIWNVLEGTSRVSFQNRFIYWANNRRDVIPELYGDWEIPIRVNFSKTVTLPRVPSDQLSWIQNRCCPLRYIRVRCLHRRFVPGFFETSIFPRWRTQVNALGLKLNKFRLARKTWKIDIFYQWKRVLLPRALYCTRRTVGAAGYVKRVPLRPSCEFWPAASV